MTPMEILEAFKEEERVEGFYEGLTATQKTERNRQYTQLKINVDIYNQKVQAKQDAKALELKAVRDSAREQEIAINAKYDATAEDVIPQ